MATAGTISRLERLSANAWPSLESVSYDGWLVRFSEGYTRRANSVIPFSEGTIPVGDKVTECERMYSGRGLDTVFKLTAASAPPALDDFLEKRGYTRESSATFHIKDLGEGTPNRPQRVRLDPEVSEGWLDAFCGMSGLDEKKRRTALRMLGAIIPSRSFASVSLGEQIVACGLGVLDGEHVGLFDVVTDKDLRRQGHGTNIVMALLDWGYQGGARSAYLQVAHGNEPALNLYRNMGFREVYDYWYRVRRHQ